MEETTKPLLPRSSLPWRAKTLLILALSALIIALALSGSMDKKGHQIVDDSFKQALIVFATARALNAVISVAQGTEVGPPGVTISIGEILDPVNDLVERFSWILLAALTSLGIQSILMDIVTSPLFNYLLIIGIVLYNLKHFFHFASLGKPERFFIKSIAFLLFVRFSMPLMSIANTMSYTYFVQPQYDIAALDQSITTISRDIGHFEQSGFSLFKTQSYTRQFEQLQAKADEAGEQIVGLIIAFVFQSIVFPLLFMYLLYRVLIGLTRVRE